MESDTVRVYLANSSNFQASTVLVALRRLSRKVQGCCLATPHKPETGDTSHQYLLLQNSKLIFEKDNFKA